MDFNTRTRNVSTRAAFHKRHPFAALTLGLPIFMLSLMMTIAAGVGFAQAMGNHQGSGQTTTVSDYNDGFATSKQDDCEQHFAPACEWLNSQSQSAALSCAVETAYAMMPFDCPKR